MIEAGKTYLIGYGRNGTQLFHIVRITKAGKPFGFRYVGSNWEISSLKVNDSRIIGEAPLPLRPRTVYKGFTTIEAFPDVSSEKIDVKPLKVEVARCRKLLDEAQEANAAGDSCKAQNAAFDVWSAPWNLLNNAKLTNSLVATPSDLATYGETTESAGAVV